MFLSSFQGKYDPAKVIVTVGDAIITGFSDGAFIRISYDEDRYFKRTGADGEVTRMRNPSRAGTIELTLMSSAGANEHLSDLANQAQIGNSPPFIIGINDLSGSSVVLADRCWVKRMPDLAFEKEIGDRVWTFDCADIDMTVGGAQSNSVFDFVVGLF
jgi:hypothetical protein